MFLQQLAQKCILTLINQSNDNQTQNDIKTFKLYFSFFICFIYFRSILNTFTHLLNQLNYHKISETLELNLKKQI